MSKFTLYTAVSGQPCPQPGEWNPFAELCEAVKPVEFSKDIDDDNGILVLWGGEDISPSLYNHVAIPGSGPEQASLRDRKEVSLASKAMKLRMPIIGVCRGAQLLCVLAGGSLFQHVTGHATGEDHVVRVNDTDELIMTNSCHHQMMELTDVDHEMIAHSENRLSQRYDGDMNSLATLYPLVEPEIVYIPRVRALCIQGHPEWYDPDSRFVRFCLEEARKII